MVIFFVIWQHLFEILMKFLIHGCQGTAAVSHHPPLEFSRLTFSENFIPSPRTSSPYS